VEAEEYFLLPLPASFFKVLLLPQNFNRFYHFHLPLPHHFPMFYEKCFRFRLLKKLLLPSLLPFPASFFKVLPLPLPLKFNHFHRFRFHIPNLESLSKKLTALVAFLRRPAGS